MFHPHSHHDVNWILVVILIVLALLLTLVQSAGYGSAASLDRVGASRSGGVAAAPNLGVQSPSEPWHLACEMFRAGFDAESRAMFERVVAHYPQDPAARMWAGMAAFRVKDYEAATAHWRVACGSEGTPPQVWLAIAHTAAQLERGRADEAARWIVPLERGDFGAPVADHPIVSFYAALVYEQLAIGAPRYRDAVEESLAERFSPALARGDAAAPVGPNSGSWLTFLARRALERTVRARAVDWTAPVVAPETTIEPSLVPTVEDLLDALGSADFALRAHQKLRALRMYRSPPNRAIEQYDAAPIQGRVVVWLPAATFQKGGQPT
jgi:hypothetical protein